MGAVTSHPHVYNTVCTMLWLSTSRIKVSYTVAILRILYGEYNGDISLIIYHMHVIKNTLQLTLTMAVINTMALHEQKSCKTTHKVVMKQEYFTSSCTSYSPLYRPRNVFKYRPLAVQYWMHAWRTCQTMEWSHVSIYSVHALKDESHGRPPAKEAPSEDTVLITKKGTISRSFQHLLDKEIQKTK